MFFNINFLVPSSPFRFWTQSRIISLVQISAKSLEVQCTLSSRLKDKNRILWFSYFQLFHQDWCEPKLVEPMPFFLQMEIYLLEHPKDNWTHFWSDQPVVIYYFFIFLEMLIHNVTKHSYWKYLLHSQKMKWHVLNAIIIIA